MSYDDVVYAMSFGKAHDLLCRMTHRNVHVGLEGLVRMLGLNSAEHILVVPARLLNHGFRLNHTAELRRAHDREHVH